MRDFFARRLSAVEVAPLEGTYLGWLDFSALGIPLEELERTLLTKARVAMTPGHIFGPGGEGFFRMNLACPRATLEQALERIAGAFD